MSDEHTRKGPRLRVDGQMMELPVDKGQDFPNQTALPPGDSVYWVDIGDTVTFEDAYGYTAHALITQVMAHEEGETKETQYEKDLREAEEWVESLPISSVSPEASWAIEAWMQARGHASVPDSGVNDEESEE